MKADWRKCIQEHVTGTYLFRFRNNKIGMYYYPELISKSKNTIERINMKSLIRKTIKLADVKECLFISDIMEEFDE